MESLLSGEAPEYLGQQSVVVLWAGGWGVGGWGLGALGGGWGAGGFGLGVVCILLSISPNGDSFTLNPTH